MPRRKPTGLIPLTQDTLQIVSWKDIQARVHKLDPEISALIDALPNSKKFRFVLIRYPFGSMIEKHGEFYIPHGNESIPFFSKKVPSEVHELTDYTWTNMPVTMILQNSMESYVALPTHIIPLRILYPGNIFSLLSLFDAHKRGNVFLGAYSSCAGSRSLVTLPKISHEQYNQRLAKRFDLSDDVLMPKTLGQQWPLFKQISESSAFEEDWQTEILLFPKALIEQVFNNPAHLNFKHALLNTLWDFTAFSRHQGMYELAWSMFADKLPAAIRNTPFIIETAKNLVKMAMRVTPGYTPCIDNQQAPIHGLIKAFIDVYKIRYYQPVFMQADYYDGENPLYYALHKHTFQHAIPQKHNANRTIDEMKHIQEIITLFTEDVMQDRLPFPLRDSIVYETLRDVEFTFYHPQGSDPLCTDINSIVKEDPRFVYVTESYAEGRNLRFPEPSIFFNGCIRIRPKPRATPTPAMKDFLMPMRKQRLS